MKYIATALLVLMTITFIVSGILLWKRRKEPNDHSHQFLASMAMSVDMYFLSYREK